MEQIDNSVAIRPKIVVLGSCSVDFTTYAQRLPTPGETLHGYKFTTSFGGKGANQCIAAAKLGAKCFMICRVGDDHWGKLYKDNLKDVGVDISYVLNTPNMTTGIAQIVVAESGENQIVIVPGANGMLSLSDLKDCEELIKQADVLIGQLETPFETTLEAFKLNEGIKILNAAPARADIHQILQYCSILCVNETEASLLGGQNVNLENSNKTLNKLLNMGCDTVIITLGSNGAIYASRHDRKPIHVFCQQVTPVDTTGAGDAFVGALASFLLSEKDKPMHQIVGAACSVATYSVTKEGTQTSYPSKFNAFQTLYKYQVL